MGKAKKQANNRMQREMQTKAVDADFQAMLEAMDPNKSYQLKKKGKFLYEGAKMNGSQWKLLFLKPKENHSEEKQLNVQNVSAQKEQLKTKQECYKSKNLCSFNCKGLCKESC